MRIVLASMVALLVACGGADDDVVECSTNAHCLQGGVGGECLPSPASSKSWCAFPDPACDSDQRWGLLAGDDLAGECVEVGTGPDAGSVDAAPDANTADLTVSRSGSGGGAIVSSPDGIDCGQTCSASFPMGTAVTLTATPEGTASFTGWSGDCEGTGTCSLTMDADRSVVARFDAPGEKIWLRHVLTAAVKSVATDSDGNIVAAGSYDGTMVDFGGGVIRTSDGLFAFVMKVSGGSGATLWAADFGSIGIGTVTGVAVDGAGDVLVVGSFTGSALQIGGEDFATAGNEDIFVVKLSGVDGAVVWARTFGSSAIDRAKGVAVGAGDNLIVVGEFKGSLEFDPTVLVAEGTTFDAFMVRLSGSAGAPLWARRFGGDMNDSADAVAVRGGVVALAGDYRGAASFGGTTLPQHGDADIVIGTYQEVDGAFVWASGYGGTGTDSGRAVAVHMDGSVYAAGSVSGTDATLGDATFSAVGDIFVARYTAAGNHTWSKVFGDSSTSIDAANAIALGPTGDVVAVGEFRESVNFGGGALFASGMSADIFLIRLAAADGAHVWSRRFGGAGADWGSAVTVDAVGSVVSGGAIPSIAEFYDEALNGAGAWLLKVAP